jgi:TfoX/Sxy family transcriptional regulator of competence genes
VVRSTRRSAPAPKAADDLADRLRAALPGKGVSERKMFGGTGFMLDGNMVAGTFRGGLLVRVGKERHDEALSRPGAGPMLMRGRAVAGYILVDGPALSGPALREWSQLALSYVRTLPPKPARPKTSRKKRGAK